MGGRGVRESESSERVAMARDDLDGTATKATPFHADTSGNHIPTPHLSILPPGGLGFNAAARGNKHRRGLQSNIEQ